jgi:para-nitrobenzyl esterase
MSIRTLVGLVVHDLGGQSMTRARLHTSLVILVLAAVACSGEPEPPTVDQTSRRSLPAGDVVGLTGQYGNHAWKGIPYAEPPSGELRWRAPRAAPRWEGVREALATGEACPQFASVFSGEGRDAKGVMGDEDCLYLDVYAPRWEPGGVPSDDALRPVLVWIHGGGNSIGRAGFYDGGNLAATQDVIVVNINYRLGPFGWFRHASLREGVPEVDRSGNFGTLDHIRALEWVRENVAAFGGDPDNVTIFGESAGGRNVVALLVSPRAEGLFHRALVQSGGTYSASAAEAENFLDAAEAGDPHSSNEIVAKLLEQDGTAADREAAKAHLAGMSSAEIAAYLREKSHQEILAAYVDDVYSFQGMLRLPQVFADGTVLPDADATELLASGSYNRVPVILGTNRDENKLFMAFDPDQARWRFGMFPVAHDPDQYDAHSDALARAWKARAVDGLARLMVEAQGPTVYAYRWDWDEEPSLPILFDGPRMFGAAHGLEIAFFFGHFDMGPDSGSTLFGRGSAEGRELLSAQMMSYLSEFAYTGAPGRGRSGELAEWVAWDASRPDAPKYVVFDTPADGGVRMSSDTYTMDRVVAEVVADARFPTTRDRCATLRQLTEWGNLTRSQYASAGSSVCVEYAYEAYPWRDVAAGE